MKEALSYVLWKGYFCRNYVMKYRIIFLSVAAVVLLSSCRGGGSDTSVSGPEDAEEVAAPQHRLGFEPDTLFAAEGKIRKNEFFSNFMARLGLDASGSYSVVTACDTVFDVRRLRAGNVYKAYYADSTLSGRPDYVVYERDASSDVVFRCMEPYSVWISERPVEVVRKYADVTIESSLWNALSDAGASPLLVLKLSDIYAWTVDFFGLQKGDRFRVLYDEKVCEGSVMSVDTVRYAVFTHRGEDYPVIMFDQGDGGNIYWNEKGESVRKQFLKAPLQYSRVSSGFSYSRKHPVTRRVQPHTGVDYAAPSGTPVMTIGDGVVTSMKNEGAGGNTVRIRHNSVYSTAYLHLSRYAKGLKPGQRVSQGDVIGYVGATGRCTGPHLDFRVWKNGSPINPLTMQSPPAEPLKEEYRAAFDSVRIVMKASFPDRSDLR